MIAVTGADSKVTVPASEAGTSGEGRRWKAIRPRKDPDEPKPGWPKTALLVVIVPSLWMMFLDLSYVPLPLVLIGYGLPILGILLLGNHIRKVPRHTRRDKRRLWLFFLGCYVMGTGLFLVTNGGQTVLVKANESGSFDIWESSAGIRILWTALPLLFIGLIILLVLLSGYRPQERPSQYSGVLLGITLFCVLMVPYVNQSHYFDEKAEFFGWPSFDPIPPPGDEVRLWPLTRYLHGSYIEEEAGSGVMQDPLQENGLKIMLSMGILVMIFTSLWSLFRPKTYDSTVGLTDSEMVHDTPDEDAKGNAPIDDGDVKRVPPDD